MIKVTCLGAAGSVTGSCFLVESVHGHKVLVDCGLFQGGRQMEERNWRDWDFNPSQIDMLFLTHAHIDHSGRIPKLVKDGFKGKIITSPPTAQLCEIMLLDAAHIQEMDAQWQTRKNRRRPSGRAVKPLYTVEDAQASLKHLYPVEHDEIIAGEPAGVSFRVKPDPFSRIGNDSNTVDLDREMMKLTQNQILYEASSQMIQSKIEGIKNAIRSIG